MKKLVEVHVLQNFAPSNLNRDDTGAPKDALFDGTRRARISSQCQKRAVRVMFDGGSVLARDDLAVRTKRLLKELTDRLAEKGRERTEAEGKAQAALAAAGLGVKEEGKTEYLLFFGRREIQNLAELIDKNWDSLIINAAGADGDDAPKGKKAKKGDAKQGNPEIAKAVASILNGGKAADVALFGRMLADMPETNQNAACQVAHALSTHTVEREFDYYTAIDDLKPTDTAGADMIGVIDFNSACFYRYACLDIELLEKNLQGDRELTMKTVRAFLDAFVRSEPTGKQNSFAAHNPSEFILVRTATDAAPVNLANAFESPIRPDWKQEKSLTRLSAEALTKKAVSLRKFYGNANESDTCHVMNACDAETPKELGEIADSWPGLLEKTVSIVGAW